MWWQAVALDSQPNVSWALPYLMQPPEVLEPFEERLFTSDRYSREC